MGCGSSSPKGNAGERSYNATKEAAKRVDAAQPLTPAGLEEKRRLDASFETLKQQIVDARQAADAEFGTQDAAKVVAESEYVRHLAESLDPSREFDAGWMTLRYPDNGQWKVAMDKRSGQVMITPVAQVLGSQMGFSFAPMRSEVDSAGYRDMFIANLRRVYSDLPKMIAGKLVMEMELEPFTGPTTLSGFEVYEWRMRTKMMDGSHKPLANMQIEVHGMRNEEQPTPGGFQYFGFNGSLSTAGYPDGAHAALERVFREVVLDSLVLRPIDVIEKQFIGFWKQ